MGDEWLKSLVADWLVYVVILFLYETIDDVASLDNELDLKALGIERRTQVLI
jgi:hypothetical protein